MVTVPPCGIASRALMTRFTSTCSSWRGSASAGLAVLVALHLEPRAAAERAREQALHVAHHVVQVDLRRCAHLLAAEGEQLAGERRATLHRLADVAHVLAQLALRRQLGSRASAAAPSTTLSRLLKSWATPPASRPTASIFCAWRSCASTLALASPQALLVGDVVDDDDARRPALEVEGVRDDVDVDQRAIGLAMAVAPTAALRLEAAPAREHLQLDAIHVFRRPDVEDRHAEELFGREAVVRPPPPGSRRESGRSRRRTPTPAAA